jgi:hypothetical protein
MLSCVVAAGLVLPGCGESGEAQGTARATAKPRPVATSDPTKQEIRELANGYLAAIAAKDWSGVCKTMAPSERVFYLREWGSCEKAFRSRADDVGAYGRRIFRNSRAAEIRIGPEQAVIDVSKLGSHDVLVRLHAIREDGRWGIARSKKDRED